jgi:hypothetical protein
MISHFRGNREDMHIGTNKSAHFKPQKKKKEKKQKEEKKKKLFV